MVYMHEKKSENLLLAELQTLNGNISRQLSVRRIFFTGIVYGIGFFLGSAVLAVIALGIFGPMIGSIPWVEETFHRGTVILHEGN